MAGIDKYCDALDGMSGNSKKIDKQPVVEEQVVPPSIEVTNESTDDFLRSFILDTIKDQGVTAEQTTPKEVPAKKVAPKKIVVEKVAPKKVAPKKVSNRVKRTEKKNLEAIAAEKSNIQYFADQLGASERSSKVVKAVTETKDVYKQPVVKEKVVSTPIVKVATESDDDLLRGFILNTIKEQVVTTKNHVIEQSKQNKVTAKRIADPAKRATKVKLIEKQEVEAIAAVEASVKSTIQSFADQLEASERSNKIVTEATMDGKPDTLTDVETTINNKFQGEMANIRKLVEMSSGGGGNESRSIQNATDIATLSADVGAFENVTSNQREQFQGYIALLSPVYFDGAATIANIAIEDVNTWIDIELAVDPAGEFDHRVTSMKTAQAQGYTGTGANADPIIFLLEGLELTSSADIRVSMSYNPDEDGGRLDSRLNFFRHSGTTPSANFHIEASSLSMESGAEEDYSYTPDVKFFIGDTIDTNAAGDAGRVCFQIKSDVPGTVTLNEIAMFIQK